MVDYQTSSITASFGKKVSATDYKFSLGLDTDFNTQYHGMVKTQFAPGEVAFLKLKPVKSICPSKLISSVGTITYFNLMQTETVTETISFKNEIEASLSDIPLGAISSVNWLIGTPVNLTLSGSTLTAPSKMVAICEVTYNVSFDRVKLTIPATFTGNEVIVLADFSFYNPNLQVLEAKVSVGVDTTPITPTKDVDLVIKDIANDQIIPNANVVVSQAGQVIFNGLADSNGIVSLKQLTVGKTYDLLTKATGFIDSDQDYLNNDSFTVQ